MSTDINDVSQSTDSLPADVPVTDAVVEEQKPVVVEANATAFDSLLGELREDFNKKLEISESALAARNEEYEKVVAELGAANSIIKRLIVQEGAVFKSGDTTAPTQVAQPTGAPKSFQQLAEEYFSKEK